jgi:hypothetical protein
LAAKVGSLSYQIEIATSPQDAASIRRRGCKGDVPKNQDIPNLAQLGSAAVVAACPMSGEQRKTRSEDTGFDPLQTWSRAF